MIILPVQIPTKAIQSDLQKNGSKPFPQNIEMGKKPMQAFAHLVLIRIN